MEVTTGSRLTTSAERERRRESATIALPLSRLHKWQLLPAGSRRQRFAHRAVRKRRVIDVHRRDRAVVVEVHWRKRGLADVAITPWDRVAVVDNVPAVGAGDVDHAMMTR